MTLGFLTVRYIASFVTGSVYYHFYVTKMSKPKLSAFERYESETVMAAFREDGTRLYLSFIINFITGTYRMLPVKDFKQELTIGYIMELLLQITPLAFCQSINNFNTEADLEMLQSAALLFKMACLLTMVIELVILIWETWQLKKLRELGFRNYNALSEKERRA